MFPFLGGFYPRRIIRLTCSATGSSVYLRLTGGIWTAATSDEPPKLCIYFLMKPPLSMAATSLVFGALFANHQSIAKLLSGQ
jgi:hypothetical protein